MTPDRVAGAGLDPCRGNWALPLLALPSRLVSVLIYLLQSRKVRDEFCFSVECEIEWNGTLLNTSKCNLMIDINPLLKKKNDRPQFPVQSNVDLLLYSQ